MWRAGGSIGFKDASQPRPLVAPQASHDTDCMTDPRASLDLVSWLLQDVDPVSNNAALVSFVNKSSDFTFNFATAWFPAPVGEVSAVQSKYLPLFTALCRDLYIIFLHTSLVNYWRWHDTNLFWNLLGVYRQFSRVFGYAAQ
jgi:hypothetical protein